MNVLTVDFETYYDSEHSISEMCMGEYLRGKKAQLIMMSYKFNDGVTQCAVGEEEMAAVLKTFDWSQVAVCSHNGDFDFRIIMDYFGYTPAFFFDTLGMMSATGGNVIANGNSLDCVAKLLQGAGIPIADKGEERAAAKGKRLFRFPDGRWYMHEEEINDAYISTFHKANYTKAGKLKKGKKSLVEVARDAIKFFEDYKAYCIHDTEICYAALQYFTKLLPVQEIRFQDMIKRCYVLPRLQLDMDVLQKEKRRLDKRRLEKIKPIADKYLNGNIEETKNYLRSKGLFGVMLKSIGGVTDGDVLAANSRGEELEYSFIIPTKVSEKTGKVDYAFSLTDEGFIRLSDVSPELKELCDARKEMASSIEHSRTQRFIDSAKWEPLFGLPYKISGAATHRLSGNLSINVQNLSSGRKEGQTTALRDSIVSAPGEMVIACDSSQIEARVESWLSNCALLLEAFTHGKDVYSITASKIYNEDADVISAGNKAGDADYKFKRTLGKVTTLGAGYGMSGAAFKDYLFLQTGIEITAQEADDIIKAFRAGYAEFPKFWRDCGKVLDAMLAGASGYFGGPNGNTFYYDGNYQIHGKTVPSIIGPDGMRLSYYKLCKRSKTYEDGTTRENFAYWGLKEGRYQWVYIYSAKLTENLCQYLAFAVMKYQGLLINNKYPVSLNTHDEWGLAVKEAEVEQAQQYVEQCMRTVPPWAEGLPINCESAVGKRYGDC